MLAYLRPIHVAHSVDYDDLINETFCLACWYAI